MTLKAEPSRCVLRGDALRHAIARQPMSFDIEFVDNLGQVAYAEELEVHVESLELLPSARPQLLEEEIEIASPHLAASPRDRISSSPSKSVPSTAPAPPSTAPATSKTLPPPAPAKSLPPPTTAPPTTAPDVGPAGAGNKSSNGKGKPGVVVGAKEGGGSSGAGKAGAKGGGGSAVVGGSSLGNPKLPSSWPNLDVGDDSADPDDVAIPVSSTPWLIESADTTLWERLGTARAVVGTKPLILREGLSTESAELAKVLPGALLKQLRREQAADGGTRAEVLVATGAKVQCVGEGATLQDGTLVRGWVTAVQKGGKERLARQHAKVDANERRLQLELWNKRLAADKAFEKALKANSAVGPHLEENFVPYKAAGALGGSVATGSLASQLLSELAPSAAELAERLVGPSFAYELAADARGIAFAFGGIFPGKLHAHGELVKVHQVSSGSIGTSVIAT